MRDGFAAGVCVDLGAFDPTAPGKGVEAWLERASGVPAWVVVMEDREPDFFHGYDGYRPDAPAPLNRHGPNQHAWTQADLKALVEAFQARGVKVLLGYWVHECRFVDERHPEVLIRDAAGKLWQDVVERNADFNPMRRMRADPGHGVREGERYSTWSARQYARLQRDFGFDGLFLGDGAMGFRRHGKDWKDLRHFDYHEAWLAEFRADEAFMEHEGCALHREDATTPEQAKDVQTYHWPHWVAWNTGRWTGYYREMAEAVHATGGLLAAYNCMNYDPALARLHGVDYRGIAEAGLDILVFQGYDYAWGPLGPFGFLNITRKDLATNLQALLLARAHVGHDTRMKIVVTVETEDEVEGWNSPLSHTLGEAYAYGAAASHDGRGWRRAADGAFIVWGNSVQRPEWRALAACFRDLSSLPPTPAAALVWDEGHAEALAAQGVPTATDPDALYAHLDAWPHVGEGPATSAVLTRRSLPAAAMEAAEGPARKAPSTRVRLA